MSNKSLDLDRDLLETVLATESVSGETTRMRALIRHVAADLGCTVVEDDGNLYVTKGEATLYPCLVAHTDTVHDILPEGRYTLALDLDDYWAYDRKTKEQVGIGGDDKVGIFIALTMLKELPTAKAAFFRDEEVGCKGAWEADLRFFDDCTFALECDRRGNNDCVNTFCGDTVMSPAFAQALEPLLTWHDYQWSSGLITDVMTLRDLGLPLSVTNLSCGYYDPHSNFEWVNVRDVERCLNLVRDICFWLGHTQWYHEPNPLGSRTYVWGKGWTTTKNWSTATSWDDVLDPTPYVQLESGLVCEGCHKGDRLSWDDETQDLWCERCLEFVRDLVIP